jgi:MFS family permease
MPPEERGALARALEAEERTKKAGGHVNFKAALRDPRLFHFVAILILITSNTYALAFYLPSVVSTLLNVKVGLLVGLVTSIPYCCGILAAAFWPHLGVRINRRRTFAMISLGCMGTGLVVAMNVPPAFAILAFCFVCAGIWSSQPLFWTFPAEYLGGTAAAGGIALINAVGNLGGFLGPNIKTLVEQTFHSSSAGLYAIAAEAFLACILVGCLRPRRPTPPVIQPEARAVH